MGYEKQILEILKSGESVPLFELVKVTHRFGAVIFNLREKGYVIDTQPQGTGSDGKKRFNYQLISAPIWDGWQSKSHL